MRKNFKVKGSAIRPIVALLAFSAVGIGLAFHTGTGTLSSFGFDSIASICPLGALESMLGSRSFIAHAAIVLAITSIVIFVVGKAFCSWICPVPHIKNVFKSKAEKDREAEERRVNAEFSLARWRAGEQVPKRKGVKIDSRHAVLFGSLASAAVFGFPVFCLVCPIGLSMATFVLVWRMLQFNELTWGLVLFPAIIVLEVFVLKKWCGKICPLGALMSLLSSKSPVFKPHVEKGACLRNTRESACSACSAACPEGIDPYADLGKGSLSECVKCRSCVDVCPAQAISIPFLSKERHLPSAAEGGFGKEQQGD